MHQSPSRHTFAATAVALLLAAALPAHAALRGTLYPGLGYDLVETAPGVYSPIGYMYPSMSYTLPNSSTGGVASGKGMGLGAARLSTGSAFLGQRGIVITPAGSYALGTLGVNAVPGWTPLGFGSSSAQATNAAGTVVGTSGMYSADGLQDLGGRAVVFAPGTGEPTALPLPAGFVDSNGYGIGGASSLSSSGVIIGFGTQYNKKDRSLGNRALRWRDATSVAEVLQGLPGVSEWGENTSSAVAVNAAGTAVGSGNTFDANGKLLGTLAIRWASQSTKATPLRPLGRSIDGEFASHAMAVNDADMTVGSSAKFAANFAPLGDAAVRWDARSVKPVELAGLGSASDGEAWTYALAVNNEGTVAGIAQKYDAAGASLGNRAVRWAAGSTEATELALLSQSSQGASYSYAFGLNAAGFVVGQANVVGSSSNDFSNPAALAVHAVVWTPAGKVVDLNSLLPADSGWKLFSAYSISDSGWVTGIGYYQPVGFPSNYAYPRLYSMQLAR